MNRDKPFPFMTKKQEKMLASVSSGAVGGQFQREVSGQFVEGMTIVPTFTAFWHAVVRHEDKSNNKLAVTVHSKQGGQWDEDWNLEHTIAGLNRREYKLTR